MTRTTLLLTALLTVALPAPALADTPETEAQQAPRYEKLKQVYDVAVQSTDTEERTERMQHVLNVAMYHMGMTPLEDLHITEADRGSTAPEIVIVLHGGEIALFSRKAAKKHKELHKAARALHEAGVHFRVCRGAAALMHELSADDMVDLVEMVPGGEAEIAWLQQQGFGYNFFQH